MHGLGDRALRIANTEIRENGECYVVAEIGHNHQGSLDLAKQLIDEAARCGADAVKLQKRDNRALFTREQYDKPYEHENSFGATYGEHREALELGRESWETLTRHAAGRGITLIATAFDHPSAEFLDEAGVPAFKVASGDLKNTPLLRHVAGFGKPVIVSTGAAGLDDVRRAYDTVRETNPQVALLQCTADYPAAWEELDLRVIETYRELFPDAVIGYSGHDNGIAMAVAAYVLGARIVEKHFTLDRAMRGTDHSFSLEPQGLRKLVRDLRRVRVALGDGMKAPYESELPAATKMGKKLVAARDLPAGHVLGPGDLVAKSPGDGIPPYALESLLGRTLSRPVATDAALTAEVLEEPLVESAELAPSPGR
jgi:sialic acid synthase